MLGWSFSVRDEDNVKTIAYWEGGLFSDQWLKSLELTDEAYLLKSNGGYPNIWRVRTDAIVERNVMKNQTIDLPNTQWVTIEVWDQS